MTARPRAEEARSLPLGREAACLLLLLLLAPGCGAVRRLAVGTIGDALASGGSVYETDDDPDLVGEALPFGLKLIESLLAEVPEHRGLLRTACQGFTTYAYAFVQQEAELTEGLSLEQERAMRARARRLYLRSRRYGLRGLEAAHKGIAAALAADPRTALAAASREDVPLLYWNAAALGLAISVSRGDAEMLAHLPEVDALLTRAIELDEAWQEGSLHEFQVLFAGARPGFSDADLPALDRHFERALELSGGRRASLFVGYAEAVAVRRQDAGRFRSLLERALAIDPDAHEDIRLANVIARRRARWLLDHEDDLFLGPGSREDDTGGTR